jgi:small subunit ribosomal protein S6
MSKFETVLLISPEISTTVRDNLCEEFSNLVLENSGKIVNSEDWGLKDLSYKIGNFNKAFYNFFQVEIDGDKIESIKKNLTQNEIFIRHIFVKVNNHQELPTKLANEKK